LEVHEMEGLTPLFRTHAVSCHVPRPIGKDALGIAAACVLLCVSVGSLQAQPSRLPARIDSGRTIALIGHVRPQATAQNDVGPVADSFQLPAVTLMLQPSAAQKADLTQFLAEQQDPSSQNFHQWLTPEQYADRFGVSNEDISKISEWLRSQGFSVGDVARSRTWITFSGTAAQARNAFRTEIHRYRINGAFRVSTISIRSRDRCGKSLRLK
jgi:hypothetical protein